MQNTREAGRAKAFSEYECPVDGIEAPTKITNDPRHRRAGADQGNQTRSHQEGAEGQRCDGDRDAENGQQSARRNRSNPGSFAKPIRASNAPICQVLFHAGSTHSANRKFPIRRVNCEFVTKKHPAFRRGIFHEECSG